MICGAGVRGVQTGGRENALSAWEDVPQAVVDEDREHEENITSARDVTAENWF